MKPKYLIPLFFTVLLVLYSKYSHASMIFGPATFTQLKAVISYDESSKTETLVISPSFKELTPKASLGHWKFDEGSGTTVNDTLGTYKGFIYGNVRWQDPSTCKSGSCLSFNNTNEYVSVPHSALNLPPALNQLTLSAWINPSNLVQPIGAAIIAKGNGGSSESFVLDIINNDQLRFFTWNSGQLNTCTINNWLSSHVNKWTNILVTYDGLSGTATIYENTKEVQKCEGFSSNLSINSHVLSIGSRQSASSVYDLYFDGLIDDVRMYNYVVSETKIKDIYDFVQETSLTDSKQKYYGFMIPVPSKPEVEVVKDELFTSLEDLTKPAPGMPIPIMGGAERNLGLDSREISQPKVSVIQTKKADIYDLAVLESNDEEALSSWLKENNYFLPKDSEFVLKEYIEKRYYFVVAKVNPDSISPFVSGQIREGHLNPIKMTFSTDQPTYPIKLVGASMAAMSSKSDINYLNSGTSFPNEGRIALPDTYQPMPIDPGPMPYKPSYYSIPIVIYTVAQDKQYLPGFNIEYAGYVDERKIENLATNSADKPWIDVKGKKYLTKLSRYMSPYEMNNDLVLRKADDNEPVGSGVGSLDSNTKLLLVIFIPIAAELLLFAYYFKKRRKNASGF